MLLILGTNARLIAHMLDCREAARKASAYAEDGTFMENKEPLRLPAFEKVIGFAVQKALEDWRDEALEGEALFPSVQPTACMPTLAQALEQLQMHVSRAGIPI